ncbi:MAG: DUF1684 domain-containing protein [Anaerolineales bacterium]|nr:DUF1684 domain-containing protein [Anaerolineales bacterium]
MDYSSEIQTWRKNYEQQLSAPDSWLAISALVWLKEGENRFGTDPTSEVVLPPKSAPRLAGIFRYQQGEVTLEAAPGTKMTINDEAISSRVIKLNDFGASEWIVLNDLKISIIQRGVRMGARIYDKNNPARKAFASLRWFPIEEAYHLEANFIPFDTPRMIPITNVIGDTSEEACPGRVEFVWNKQPCRLYPLTDGDGLWFIFKDASNGVMTYAGGRYMSTDGPKDGKVILDFNKAHNPPCAYTDFATCPMPSEENRLSAPIMAGEFKFH